MSWLSTLASLSSSASTARIGARSLATAVRLGRTAVADGKVHAVGLVLDGSAAPMLAQAYLDGSADGPPIARSGQHQAVLATAFGSALAAGLVALTAPLARSKKAISVWGTGLSSDEMAAEQSYVHTLLQGTAAAVDSDELPAGHEGAAGGKTPRLTDADISLARERHGKERAEAEVAALERQTSDDELEAKAVARELSVHQIEQDSKHI